MKNKTPYKLDGIRVPGVTTITGQLDKSGPLMHWAWKLGTEGFDYRKVRDQAGDIGTLAHAMAIGHLIDKEPDLSSYSANDITKAENCLIHFFDWTKNKVIAPVMCEEPLVSRMGFGGTPDFYGIVNGLLVLVDIKTGSGIYLEHYIQVSAYVYLLEEHDYPVSEVIILQLPKSEGDSFAVKPLSLDKAKTGFEIFKHLLSVYKLKKGFDK